ncbi:hypothetical protein IKS_05920 [Bacillus cereus VDM062]|nr:hypothetical protein IKS_05920 [Bacillus cereus VDM062]
MAYFIFCLAWFFSKMLAVPHEVVEGSIEALKEENERLRMEIDYLKKLKAFVQKKKKIQNKTKQK